MDVIEFLRARLDEDEKIAQATDGDEEVEWFAEQAGDRHHNLPEVGKHIGRWLPTRVLAEVAAKRAVITDHADALQQRRDRPGDVATTGWILGTLRAIYLLAQPYSSHPDFDPDWLRPIDRSVTE